MSGNRRYVPILRWKQAERLALRDLRPDVRSQITPLVQLVPESIAVGKRIPTVKKALGKVAADMRGCWGTSPIMIDLRHIDPSMRIDGNTHSLAYLARHARANSVSMIPVTGLHRDAAYQAAVRDTVAEDGRGACLRLFRRDLENLKLRADVRHLLEQIGLEPSRVDLVVDLQFHDGSCPDFASLSPLVPDIDKWRCLVVASGAFPRDLTQFKTPGRYSIARQDWLGWLGEIQFGEKLARMPIFSDYAVYHPTYMPPSFANFSASIRYTDD